MYNSINVDCSTQLFVCVTYTSVMDPMIYFLYNWLVCILVRISFIGNSCRLYCVCVRELNFGTHIWYVVYFTILT